MIVVKEFIEKVIVRQINLEVKANGNIKAR